MLSPLAFSGKVHLTTSTKETSRRSEVSKMQEYANKNDCDIVIINRDSVRDDLGKYDTLLIKEDKETGKKTFASKTFDFFKYGLNHVVPEFVSWADFKK